MLQSIVFSVCIFMLHTVAASGPQSYQKLDFTNAGFTGSYLPVKKFTDISSNESCSCEVGDQIWFSGKNAPLAEYLSVHFRGPLKLKQFAFYTSTGFTVNDNRTSSDWSRSAYYNSSSKTAENVTFLNHEGDASPCLGNALSYASSNGTGSASEATVLADDTLISSNEEYIIYSNVSCPKSGISKDCGVYRSGIPAYYGFGGITKMFLFEFEMPTETAKNSSSIGYYDLPAIWLLNDHIARTSQYPTNANCSCWASGCGEYDIFEAMNGTEKNHLYSTFHTFQGIEDLGTGIQSYGYITRNTSGTMKGGVVFDSSGDVVSFISDATTFDSTVSAETVNELLAAIPADETYSSELMSISATAPSTTSKSNGIALTRLQNGVWYYVLATFTAFTQVFLI
ncbi:YJL171C [Saccharomyces arboricola H-6]|uniref:glucan endo-1,3-beta-D-glucosidase n=1 Tax=Saccharomyces arboricola (strain H-6 / AS 2.3317 / CBS 10644) TaxID=1160507 RepID=J8Q0R9_SACAR|nr:YJL171C [Saccharomyces arboricola H-6]